MNTYVTHTLGILAALVDFVTAVAIGVGVFAAIVRIGGSALKLSARNLDSTMPEVRLALGRWLALALELALAADVLRTVMVPTWDEIGKLAAIVVLRTALNYFLEREIEQEQKKTEYAFPAAA